MNRRLVILLVLAIALAIPALAADISGKWTASFETQIGTQSYTYVFKVDGEKLTGTAESQLGKIELTEGKVKGDEVTFVENASYEGTPLKIEYKGKIAGDEIKFSRNVAGMADEQLVAKRAK